jgi:hypothetical protein
LKASIRVLATAGGKPPRAADGIKRVLGLVPLAGGSPGRYVCLVMMLFVFICLQVMDTLTTLLFLHHGVAEANPLIRAALAGSARPGVGLVLAKVFAIALATFAWRSGRKGLLWKINLLFLLCVAWNLIATLVRHIATVPG